MHSFLVSRLVFRGLFTSTFTEDVTCYDYISCSYECTLALSCVISGGA